VPFSSVELEGRFSSEAGDVENRGRFFRAVMGVVLLLAVVSVEEEGTASAAKEVAALVAVMVPFSTGADEGLGGGSSSVRGFCKAGKASKITLEGIILVCTKTWPNMSACSFVTLITRSRH
jgi:hypothetical protein